MAKPSRPLPPAKEIDANRFWSHVDRRGPKECWPWKSANQKEGYGRFKTHGRLVAAHRVAYLLKHREIPECNGSAGLLRHSCHNPPCCNPAHLSTGTASQNNMDSVRAGRWDNVTRNLPHMRYDPSQ